MKLAKVIKTYPQSPKGHTSLASESQDSNELGIRVPKVIQTQPQSLEDHTNLAEGLTWKMTWTMMENDLSGGGWVKSIYQSANQSDT